MNLNRQHKEILQALQEAGTAGINSFAYRTNWIQLPVRVKELKQMGYAIVSKRNQNRSVDYILLHSPVVKTVEPHKTDYSNLIFVGNTAYRREDLRSEQLHL